MPVLTRTQREIHDAIAEEAGIVARGFHRETVADSTVIAVLRAHSLIEGQLYQTMESRYPGLGLREIDLNFHKLHRLAFSTNFGSPVSQAIGALNRIRNRIAHGAEGQIPDHDLNLIRAAIPVNSRTGSITLMCYMLLNTVAISQAVERKLHLILSESDEEQAAREAHAQIGEDILVRRGWLTR